MNDNLKNYLAITGGIALNSPSCFNKHIEKTKSRPATPLEQFNFKGKTVKKNNKNVAKKKKKERERAEKEQMIDSLLGSLIDAVRIIGPGKEYFYGWRITAYYIIKSISGKRLYIPEMLYDIQWDRDREYFSEDSKFEVISKEQIFEVFNRIKEELLKD